MQRNGKPIWYPPAIEIGSAAIKLIQLAKTSLGYEIAKIGYWPLTPEGQAPLTHSAPPKAGPSESTLSKLPATNPGVGSVEGLTIRDQLKRLIENQKITGPVVTSLPLNKIQTLSFLLPNMPEGEIEQAIIWKLKSNVPGGGSFEGISFDYVPWVSSEEHLDRKEIRVLVFVAFKHIVMEHMKLFQGLKLEPTAIEPKPYASLEALLWLGKLPEDETIMVLQLGASLSSIVILYRGYPFLIQPLQICGNTLTQAIAHYHRFDFQKAEEVKGQAGSSQSISWPAISSQLENLIVEIEHTFRSFSHQIKLPSVVFNRMILCGGSSALPNLATFLSDRLGVPVDIFDPLGSPNLRLKTELTPVVKENAASFCSALGLAVRSIE